MKAKTPIPFENFRLKSARKYGKMAPMKTTLDIPDELFRRVKATAALQGDTLRAFVSKTLQEKLDQAASTPDKPWMQAFGCLRDLPREVWQDLNASIESEFGQIEPEDRL